MSDVQPTFPPGARDSVRLEHRIYPPVPVDVMSLTRVVHDSAARAALAFGRVQAVTRGHPVLDAHDPLSLELTAARDGLCDAVSALAASLRRDGLPPQRMLVAVKDAVRGAFPTPAEPLAARDVMSDAVRCGIAAYYAVP